MMDVKVFDVNELQSLDGGPSNGARLPWYALRVRSNFEKIAALHLKSREYEGYLPTYRSRRQWSDRIKESDLPLFPGYMFCRVDPARRLGVLTVPGVVGMVGVGNQPQSIPEEEIQAVIRLVTSGLAKPCPFLEVGQTLLIDQGPLAGVEGILTEFKGGYRIVVSIHLLQRSIAAEIDSAWVRPIRPANLMRRDALPYARAMHR